MPSDQGNRVRAGEQRRSILRRGAVRGVLAAADARALTTSVVADALGADAEAVRPVLESLVDTGEVARVELGDEHVGWEYEAATPIRERRDDVSYRVEDGETGVATRGETRVAALRRLADRIETYERGDHVGAQILTVNDTILSPVYLADVEQLREEYVRPDDRHLYVYAEDDGVREVTSTTQLNRSVRIEGFAVTGVYDVDAFDDAVEVPVETVLAETDVERADFPLGVFKAVAVRPESQGAGVGTALVTHGMAYLAETPPVVAVIWQRENEGNVRLAEEYDADRLGRFEDYFGTDWQCPECGYDADCDCAAVLYGWGFD